MNDKPQIVTESNIGWHNSQPEDVKQKKNAYRDLSTICIVPCMQSIPSKVVQNWMGMMAPMNQKFTRIFAMNMEVGKAYSETIEMILANPELSKWKYIFTLEHDNLISPDCLLKLLEDIEGYDAVGSLYYTKGVEGKPMCYGDPNIFPVSFAPFQPPPNAVTKCNGLGMGATLFRTEMFKDKRMPKPLFETIQKYEPGVGSSAFTQDLKFFLEAGKIGYRFACSTRTLTGHYDSVNDQVW
jgi:hypothetical protein